MSNEVSANTNSLIRIMLDILTGLNSRFEVLQTVKLYSSFPEISHIPTEWNLPNLVIPRRLPLTL